MRYWLFPSNQKVFDLIGALHQFDFVDWHIPGKFKIEVGDIVFMYLSKPFSQIVYKMEVVETNLPLSSTDQMEPFWVDEYALRGERWARLNCIGYVPHGYVPLQNVFLMHHGIKTFQFPQLLKDETSQYILEEFSKGEEQ